MDESTDTIIAAKGARERILPTSMTKVLTVLTAAEHISEEELDDTFTMTLEITVYDMAVIMKAAIHNDLCREFLSAHIYTTKPTE